MISTRMRRRTPSTPRRPATRWVEMILSGLLAASIFAAFAWAGPRKRAEEPSSGAIPASPEPAVAPKGNAQPQFAGKLPITELNEQEAILHALNRLGFGPWPGEVEQIEKTGLETILFT